MTDPVPRLPAPQGRPRLAEHIEESVDEVVEFHLVHARAATPLQRRIDHVTSLLSRPSIIVVLIAVMAAWMGANLIAGAMSGDGGAPDGPPFAWLELAATLTALLVAVLILVTQRREDQLAERRAQLTLELALLADRKSAKLIALIEEMRRDHPDLADRIDPEFVQMSTPADPASVLAAIDERSSEELAGAGGAEPESGDDA